MTVRDTASDREQFAEAFGQSLDPLAEYVSLFERLEREKGLDPFKLYVQDRLEAKDRHDGTIRETRRYIRQWREHMATVDGGGRHPACPTERHVTEFIRRERTGSGEWVQEGGNMVSTVRGKLTRLNAIYEHWQSDGALPHDADFNPFERATETYAWDDDPEKEPHPLAVDDLRDVVQSIKNVRERAIVVVGLKLGLRAGEVRNMQIQDLHISHPGLESHFSEMGTHRLLDGRENALVVPEREERPGNKSKVPAILPLDEEVRRTLVNHLLVRTDDGKPWVFLSETTHDHIEDKDAINAVWKRHFHPEYEETAEYRPVTSHFGRHFFSSFWRFDADAFEYEEIQYMRGDKVGKTRDREALDEYLHPHYDRIEQKYRENVFRLNI